MQNSMKINLRFSLACNLFFKLVSLKKIINFILNVFFIKKNNYDPFQTTATFQRLHYLSCLCKSGILCTEADLSKYCYLLR